jgi:hypothetical protein
MTIHRVEISIHHGPDGALSLIRAAAGRGTGAAALNHVVHINYPTLLNNFHFSSCATVLAATLVVKKRIVVYRDMQATPALNLKTVAATQIEFTADQNRTASNRV